MSPVSLFMRPSFGGIRKKLGCDWRRIDMQTAANRINGIRIVLLLFTIAATELFAFQLASADITIISRDSFARAGAFSGSGGAVSQGEFEDNTEALTGMFSFSESVMTLVTEDDPFSTGSATSSCTVSVMDNVIHSPSSLTLTTVRNSTASVQHISGPSNATASARHNFRVRFSVDDQPVRYTLSGTFDPGPIVNGFNRMALYRPFTANTIFEFETPVGSVSETGILQPGLTYEFRARVFDGLGAGANDPSTTESTSYNAMLHVENVLIGDVNLDGVVNLLDVEPFIDAISTGQYQFEADINADDEVNLLDVNPFIAILSGGG